MTTPQYIPPEFQQQLDLPSTTSAFEKAKATKAAQAALAKAKFVKTTSADSLAAAKKRRDALQDRLANKKLSAKQRQSLRAQLAGANRDVAKFSVSSRASAKGVITAQNKVYEVTGQFDKLLTGENRDAYAALRTLFDGYGLGSLAPKIYDYVKQGFGADTITLLLQDTPEYKKRFAGNETRVKNGLPVLSPADYLATERAYRDVLQSSGLPVGFYDNPADFQNWIAGDVSPTEIKSRVDLATQWVNGADAATKRALQGMYGVDESHLVAYALDHTRAVPLMQQQARAAEIGAAALRRGFELNRADFEDLAGMGITGEGAEQGFSQIADSYSTLQDIAARFGLTWSQQEAEQEVFTPGAGTGLEKGKRLRSQERALFANGQGSSVQGLNPGYSPT